MTLPQLARYLAGVLVAMARHIFLVGIALAAAGSLCLTTAVEFMKDARLVPESAVVPYWLAMMILWAAGTLTTALYYRLRR